MAPGRVSCRKDGHDRRVPLYPVAGIPAGHRHRSCRTYVEDAITTVYPVVGGDIAPVAPAIGPAQPGSAPPVRNDTSTAEAAKNQAGQVADTAKQAATQVAGTVKEQAGQVTAEAGKQAKQLLSQAQSEVTEQAAATQQRVRRGTACPGGRADRDDEELRAGRAGDRPGPSGRGQGAPGRRMVWPTGTRAPCSKRSGGPSPAANRAPTWQSRSTPASWRADCPAV
jgi:uncharacterized protein YjbJ (UPF0337 family)